MRTVAIGYVRGESLIADSESMISAAQSRSIAKLDSTTALPAIVTRKAKPQQLVTTIDTSVSAQCGALSRYVAGDRDQLTAGLVARLFTVRY
jgi:hypothetical protein